VSSDQRDQPIIEPCGLTFAQLRCLADEKLMKHLQAGHGDALAVLFDRYHRLVLSIGLKILRDTAEADAYHRSMNRRQYLKTRSFYDQSSASEAGLLEKSPATFGNGLLAPPEVRNLVREGLESLKQPQRRTLEMAYCEGMSLKEIADATGESLGNVRHHYYRGLSRLRALIVDGDGSGLLKEKSEILRRGVVDAEA
jgi:RNA polymerase sigma-70 factor (ECF subfamily)